MFTVLLSFAFTFEFIFITFFVFDISFVIFVFMGAFMLLVESVFVEFCADTMDKLSKDINNMIRKMLSLFFFRLMVLPPLKIVLFIVIFKY